MAVGFKGYFFACQRAAKHMVEQKRGGSLICLSSVHAVNPCEQWTVYGSCKAALERMVKGLAVDLRGTGISANAIAPVRATSGVIISSWSGSGTHVPLAAIAQGAIANSLPSAEDRGKVDGPIDPNWGLTFDGIGAPRFDGLSVDCSAKPPSTKNAVRGRATGGGRSSRSCREARRGLRCASLALSPLPLIFSYTSENPLCGTVAAVPDKSFGAPSVRAVLYSEVPTGHTGASRFRLLSGLRVCRISLRLFCSYAQASGVMSTAKRFVLTVGCRPQTDCGRVAEGRAGKFIIEDKRGV